MSDRLKELREKRGKIINDMRELLDGAEAEKRDLTDEEQATYDKMFVEQEKNAASIKTEERQQELDREAAGQAASGQADQNGGEDDAEARAKSKRENLEMRAFEGFLRTGQAAGEGADELRALQADADTEGGFLVVPEQFSRQLIRAVDDQVHVRRRATVMPVTNADSLGVPTLDTDPADADWTVELATGSEDSSMALGKRELHPHPVAKLLKVSNKLIRVSAIPIEQLIRERLAYKFGITQEKAFLTGTGARQPLGLFTASNDGIGTARDVSTGNTTTSVQFDGLIEAKYSVKAAYWPRASWLFHRDALKQITKLKDGEGQYIWRPSVREGEPDRILNAPYDMSEYAPNTFTTGLYVGLFGDLSFYWIADAIGTLQMQRLVELYAATNQVGFIGRLETDGMPVLAEAFARVKLA